MVLEKERKKKTRIVCTIGPASEDKKVLTKLVQAGMNVMRLNFSHGDFEEHGGRIKTLREINKELNKNVAILLKDLKLELVISLVEKLNSKKVKFLLSV
jgi:pyruvate kinase